MDFLYFLIGLGASVVGAISGIGGGVIIKPVMDSLGTFDVQTISFLSGNTVLAMTSSSLIRNRKSEVVIDKKLSSYLAFGGILGGLCGKYIFDIVRSHYQNERVIGSAQSILLIFLTVSVLLFTLFKGNIKPFNREASPLSLVVGFVLGGLSSFLGIGGGPINLAVLYLFYSMDTKTAVLNSIFIIFCSQLTNLIFTIAQGNIPIVPLHILLLMIVGGIGGGIFGSHLSKGMSHKGIDNLFSGVMVVIISISIFNLSHWYIA